MNKLNLSPTNIAFYCFLLLAHITHAQNLKWASSFSGEGYDVGNAVASDAQGNIYSTGYFQGKVDFNPGSGVLNFTAKGNEDMYITKQDAKGNFVWARHIGGQGFERGNAITTDAEGNVYATGYFDGTVDFNPNAGVFNLTSNNQINIFILKLDANGNFIWAKKLGGTYGLGSSIKIDNAGNIYTCGSFFGTIDFNPGIDTFNLTSFGETDVFIGKYDTQGNLIWVKQMGGTKYDYCNGIAIDASGGVYTTGYFESTADFNPGTAVANLTASSEYDMFISKLDTAGNYAWAKAIGGSNWDIGNAITTDIHGDVFITGNFNETVDFNPGSATFNLTSSDGSDDVFILKLTPAGNFVWAKKMGGNSTDDAYSIVTDASGNIYTTGYYHQMADFDPNAGTTNLYSEGGFDVFISKLDGSGNFQWAKSIGGYSTDNGKSITLNGDAVIITGSFQDTVDFDPNTTGVFKLWAEAGSDAFVLRLNPCAARASLLNYTLTVNLQPGASYQWINCDTKQPIDGETTKTYTPKANGNYAVVVSNGTCSDTSSCLNVTFTGLYNTPAPSTRFTVYPNPTDGVFSVEFTGFDKIYDIIVFDVLGRIVFAQENQKETSEIDLSNCTDGTYFVQLKSANELMKQKVVLRK